MNILPCTQGWDIVIKEDMEKMWTEKYEEFMSRTKCE